MVKQRLASTVVHLIIDGSKVRMVLLMMGGNIEDSEPALIEPRGHDPVLITGHKQAHIVLDPDRLLAFEFNEVTVTGDQVAQLAFGTMVAGPEAFIGLEQQARHQM